MIGIETLDHKCKAGENLKVSHDGTLYQLTEDVMDGIAYFTYCPHCGKHKKWIFKNEKIKLIHGDGYKYEGGEWREVNKYDFIRRMRFADQRWKVHHDKKRLADNDGFFNQTHYYITDTTGHQMFNIGMKIEHFCGYNIFKLWFEDAYS